jgi:predicted PurR-regulated permease PerM
VLAIVLPLAILGSFVLREALSIYTMLNTQSDVSFIETLSQFETFIQKIIPSFSFDMASVVQQTASFVVDNLLSLFAGTASTIFLFLIALIACYYFFKDGKHFTTQLIKLSPLKDTDDTLILKRLALAVRSVALGTVTVALIQGVLTALGLFMLGFDRAILWGCIAAIGALVPGVGTAIVLVPAVTYLIYTGAHLYALILGLWGLLAVGLIDNLLGPYLMSKGNNVHPFLILLSVLGGISLFGPIGFILGPVLLSFFLVLLELYHLYIKHSEK